MTPILHPLRKLAFCATLGASGVCAHAAPTYDVLFGGPGPSSLTDTPFVNTYGGTNLESFGFEVSFNSTSDARINALIPGSPNNTFQFSAAAVDTPTWVSGRAYTFVESYSGDATKKLNISVTDTVTNTTYTIPEYTVSFGNVQSLVVRMVAPDPDIAPNQNNNNSRPTAGSLSFTNWTLTGGPSIAGMPPLVQLFTTDTVGDDIRLISYFSLAGIDFTQPWSLAGTFTMEWSGSTIPAHNPTPLPGPNDLAFQVKAFQGVIPEASSFATLAGLLAGAATLLRLKRRGFER